MWYDSLCKTPFLANPTLITGRHSYAGPTSPQDFDHHISKPLLCERGQRHCASERGAGTGGSEST